MTRTNGVTRWLATLLALSGCSTSVGVGDSVEEGVFRNRGVDLHYVIDFPAGNGPFPGVVIGHGSGPKTIRDYDGFATRMLRGGLAVLRYDKRGTGESGGTFVPSNDPAVNDAIPDLYAPDMAAAFQVLAAHPRILDGRVGLLGESQAGWVIPPAALAAGGAAFVVLLSGPVMPLGDVGAYEAYATAHPELDADSIMRILASNGSLTGGGFDPTPFLTQLDIPGLWIYGEHDRHVPGPPSVRVLEAEVAARAAPFTTILYPNADHGLRDVDSGAGIPWWDDVLSWVAGLAP